MLQLVLAIGRPELQATKELYQLNVESGNPGLIRGALAIVLHLLLDFGLGLCDQFLDSSGMDSSVRKQLEQ